MARVGQHQANKQNRENLTFDKWATRRYELEAIYRDERQWIITRSTHNMDNPATMGK